MVRTDQLVVARDYVGAQLFGGGLCRFADDRVLEIARPEVHPAGAETAPAAAAAEHRRARPLRLALAFGHGQDFGGVDVDDARVETHDGFALLAIETAKADFAEPTADAANALVLGVVAELGDTADDDRVNAEELPELGGGVRICAIAVREILFRHDLVERFPLNDGIRPVFNQVFHQQVGDALAYIYVLPEDAGHPGVHGGIVKIHHGDPLLPSLGCRGQGGYAH